MQLCTIFALPTVFGTYQLSNLALATLFLKQLEAILIFQSLKSCFMSRAYLNVTWLGGSTCPSNHSHISLSHSPSQLSCPFQFHRIIKMSGRERLLGPGVINSVPLRTRLVNQNETKGVTDNACHLKSLEIKIKIKIKNKNRVGQVK